MRTAALIVFGALSVIALGTAAAEPVRVRVTARVSDVSDPGQSLGGRIVFGQRVTGTYVYNTNTPNESPDPQNSGQYRPFANEARLRFVAGGLVFESVQPTQQIAIFIQPHVPFGHGQFLMTSDDNKPLANGAQVTSMYVDFQGQGNLTQSSALPNVAPDLLNYDQHEVVLTGNSGGSFFEVRANIEVAELIVASSLEILPAAGDFVTGQHFDTAVLLPRGSNVLFARATANGNGIGLQYPGTACQLVPPPNNAAKPVILCTGAEAALAAAGGAPIEWNVEMTNGTVLTETVEWRIVQ